MLTDEQLDFFGELLVPLFQDLEGYVLNDIARRLAKEKRWTETAELMAGYLRKLGYSPYKIRIEVLKKLNADKDFIAMLDRNTLEEKAAVQEAIDEVLEQLKEISPELYEDVGNMAFNNDLSEWAKAGETLTRGTAVDKYIAAVKKRATGDLLNLTKTIAFRSYTGKIINAREAFVHAMNNALTQITSGAVSSGQATRDAIKELTQSGMRVVEYGKRTVQIESAVSTAVRTAASQLAGEIMEANIEETGVEMVQVSAHWGARPSHEAWQGKVYTLEQFRTVCGYGEPGNPSHIYSYNCRHNHYPFWPGISEPLEYEPEPGPFVINGRSYTYYQATQKQRDMEREIRALKKENLYAREENKALIRKKTADYKAFADKTGIRAKLERCQVVGYDKGSPVPGGGKIKKFSGLDVYEAAGYTEEAKEMRAYISALRAKENFAAVPNSITARTHKEKFTGYFLNKEHPTGKFKARLFDSILGYNESNWEELSDKLFDGVQTAAVKDVAQTEHGIKYKCDIRVKGLKGKEADVHTVWQIDKNNPMPRIVTAYPLKETTKEVGL
ncbi:MAG: hypothetical protein IJO77_01260 [Oscillospiraceae bacterium]|nr:hypothetical protein [Oscillospiraceae bacterium]